MRYSIAGRALARRMRGAAGIPIAGLLIAAAASCGTFQSGGAEPALSSLTVRNLSFFDVNVYSIASTGAQPVRLGTVVGTSDATFPLHSYNLQPGGILVVRIHAIGGRGSWTSPGVTVGDGVLAVLDVTTDPFGDCSTSSLHTIVVADTIPPAAR